MHPDFRVVGRVTAVRDGFGLRPRLRPEGGRFGAVRSDGQGDEETARLTEATADRAERLSGYLRDSDGDRFLRDIEGFARRRPVVAATADFLVGLVASRLLTASSERRAFSPDGDADSTERRYGTHQAAVSQQDFGPAEAGY